MERLLNQGPEALLRWLCRMPPDQNLSLWPLLAWLENALVGTPPNHDTWEETVPRYAPRYTVSIVDDEAMPLVVQMRSTMVVDRNRDIHYVVSLPPWADRYYKTFIEHYHKASATVADQVLLARVVLRREMRKAGYRFVVDGYIRPDGKKVVLHTVGTFAGVKRAGGE